MDESAIEGAGALATQEAPQPAALVFYRRLPRFDYAAPGTLEEALDLLARHGDGRGRALAGGTDLLLKLKKRAVPAPEIVVDLKRVAGLDYLRYEPGAGLRLGALTTLAAVQRSPVIRERYPLLSEAASAVFASPQIRNRATVVGNVCSAIPSADTPPPLSALGARLRLASREGERVVAVDDFFCGPGETVLRPGELVREIEIPDPPEGARSTYLKLSPRRAQDLAVVGVAVGLRTVEGRFEDVRVALGAVAPTPIRARQAEELLRGQPVEVGVVERAARAAAAEARPIDDHRASAEYRRSMVEVLVRRAVALLAGLEGRA